MAEVTVYAETDNRILESYDGTYANAREGTGFGLDIRDSGTNSQTFVGQALSESGATKQCDEVVARFATGTAAAALPVGATITGAVLRVHIATVFANSPFVAEVRLHPWGPTVEEADFVPGSGLADLPLLCSLATADMVSDALQDFGDVALLENMNIAGDTFVVFATDRHRTGDAPVMGLRQEWFSFHWADDAETDKRPRIVITYTEPAAADELWIADPDDVNYPDAPTTALVDLNPVGCIATAYGFVLMDVPTPDARAPRRSLSFGSLNRDGSRLAAQSHENAPLTFRIGYKGDPSGDFTQILAAARELAEAMLAGGVLAWKVAGMAEPVFYDFEPSGVAHYLQGQGGGLYRLARKLIDTDGLEVVFDAYPWPRPPEVIDSASVSNNTLAQHTVVLSTGNVAGEARHRIAPDGDLMGWLAVGIKPTGDLVEWATWYARDSAAWDLHTDTTLEADTSAMNDEAAETDFADAEYNAWRFRSPHAVTDPTAAEGKHRIWIRVRAVGSGERSLFRVQPRLGFTSGDLMQKVGQRWPMDWRNVPVGQLKYIWFDLGLVSIPEGVADVNVDVWAERLEGEQSLRFDQVVLMPAGEYEAVGAVPGFRLGRWGKQEWNAEELTGTGTLRDGTYRLNADGEIAATPDVLLPAGVHSVKFRGVMREPQDTTITDGPNPTSNVLGKVSVIATDSMAVETVRAVMNVRNIKNRQQDRRTKAMQFTVTGADVADGTTFRYEVEQTAATKDGRAIRVIELEAGMVPTVPSGDVVVLHNDVRADKGRAYVESGGASVFAFPLENELLWQPKGSAGYVWLLGDIPEHEGYAEIDERGPVAIAVRDRAAEIATAHTDRATH